jgi:hypothetical protein
MTSISKALTIFCHIVDDWLPWLYPMFCSAMVTAADSRLPPDLAHGLALGHCGIVVPYRLLGS